MPSLFSATLHSVVGSTQLEGVYVTVYSGWGWHELCVVNGDVGLSQGICLFLIDHVYTTFLGSFRHGERLACMQVYFRYHACAGKVITLYQSLIGMLDKENLPTCPLQNDKTLHTYIHTCTCTRTSMYMMECG